MEEHLRGTARRAAEYAGVFGAGELAGHLGLLHDVGKGSCAWQEGLKRAERSGGRVGVEHKTAGCFAGVEYGKLGAFALPVLGHHGGLPDARGLKDAMREARGNSRVRESIDVVSRLVPEILEERSSTVPEWGRNRHIGELLLRMAFSALVDADHSDTGEHFHGVRRDLVPLLGELAGRFEKARADFLAGAEDTAVNRVRGAVYEQAVAAAGEPRGIFPFAAPTGAGKTIASGGFAVHHAAAHGLRRVVIAVPYLSITQQNADVYRKLFGEENVLEHHSGVDLDGLAPGQAWQRLAAENWDAPVVVTTTVRLFESLFGRKPSAMRRIHRLAGSVIVLDEVQSLPDELLLPILSGLRHLTEFFGASVVLSSATQPAFFDLDVFRELKPRELLTDVKAVGDSLRRVRYRWETERKRTFAEVAADAAKHRQVLAVVNTTGDAAKLHEHLDEVWKHDGPVLHLSTRMAAGHRRETLERIRAYLDAGASVAVVSTQLVEAGVDLDFPAVYRAKAPAEALAQAAGRANRNGRLPEGTVVIFDPSDGSSAGTRMVYGAALETSDLHFGPDLADPDDPDALHAYYRDRYALRNLERSGTGKEIQDLRAEWLFQQVADRFKMIKEESVPVLVRWGDDEERDGLRDLLTAPGPTPPEVHRRLQPYLAVLPGRAAADAAKRGLASTLLADERGNARLYEWSGAYDERRGIRFTDLPPEEFFW